MSELARLSESYREEYELCKKFELAALLVQGLPDAQQTYDDFMWNYVGDPILGSAPSVVRTRPRYGEVDYSDIILSSYSHNGFLVHVRAPRGAWTVHGVDEPNFFIVTADLNNFTITEWFIALNDPFMENDGQTVNVGLHKQPVVASSHQEEYYGSSRAIHDSIAMLIQAQKEKNYFRSLPRLMLSNQGCRFKPQDGTEHELGSISKLAKQIAELKSLLNSYTTDKSGVVTTGSVAIRGSQQNPKSVQVIA